MLLDKLAGRPFVTELPRPRYGSRGAGAAGGAGVARIALVSSGGVVPRGNPDRLEASTATKWLAYSIAGHDTLTARGVRVHPCRLRHLQRQSRPPPRRPAGRLPRPGGRGRIGALDDTYYATVGNLTPVASAERFAREIAGQLRADGVQAVLLTAT